MTKWKPLDERHFDLSVTCAASAGFRIDDVTIRHKIYIPSKLGNWRWLFLFRDENCSTRCVSIGPNSEKVIQIFQNFVVNDLE